MLIPIVDVILWVLSNNAEEFLLPTSSSVFLICVLQTDCLFKWGRMESQVNFDLHEAEG